VKIVCQKWRKNVFGADLLSKVEYINTGCCWLGALVIRFLACLEC